MYVVRRAFRNYGQMAVPGSVVEPGAVKRFKSRLNERYIVEVTEQDFDKWDKYFKERFGVAIQVPEGEVPEGEVPEGEVPEGEVPEDEVPEDEADEPKPTVVVKPILK